MSKIHMYDKKILCGYNGLAEQLTLEPDHVTCDACKAVMAKPPSHALDYVGPEGAPCSHLRHKGDRVTCGYDCVKTYIGERHVIVDKLENVTCTSCRVVAEQGIRHTICD